MTERDKQLREAMDLLQVSRFVLENAEPLFRLYAPAGSVRKMRSLASRIHRLQKRWSKSQKQPK